MCIYCAYKSCSKLLKHRIPIKASPNEEYISEKCIECLKYDNWRKSDVYFENNKSYILCGPCRLLDKYRRILATYTFMELNDLCKNTIYNFGMFNIVNLKLANLCESEIINFPNKMQHVHIKDSEISILIFKVCLKSITLENMNKLKYIDVYFSSDEISIKLISCSNVKINILNKIDDIKISVIDSDNVICVHSDHGKYNIVYRNMKNVKDIIIDRNVREIDLLDCQELETLTILDKKISALRINNCDKLNTLYSGYVKFSNLALHRSPKFYEAITDNITVGIFQSDYVSFKLNILLCVDIFIYVLNDENFSFSDFDMLRVIKRITIFSRQNAILLDSYIDLDNVFGNIDNLPCILELSGVCLDNLYAITSSENIIPEIILSRLYFPDNLTKLSSIYKLTLKYIKNIIIDFNGFDIKQLNMDYCYDTLFITNVSKNMEVEFMNSDTKIWNFSYANILCNSKIANENDSDFYVRSLKIRKLRNFIINKYSNFKLISSVLLQTLKDAHNINICSELYNNIFEKITMGDLYDISILLGLKYKTLLE